MAPTKLDALAIETKQLQTEIRERHPRRAPGEAAFHLVNLAIDLGAFAVIGGGFLLGMFALVSLVGTIPGGAVAALGLVGFVALGAAITPITERRQLLKLELAKRRVLFLEGMATSAATTGVATSTGIPSGGVAPNYVRAASWAFMKNDPKLALARLERATSAAACGMRAYALLRLGDKTAALEQAAAAFAQLDVKDANASLIVVDVGGVVGLVDEAFAAAEAACAEKVYVPIVAAVARAAMRSCTREHLQRVIPLLDRAAVAHPNAVALFVLDDMIRYRLGVDLDRLDKMQGSVVGAVEYHEARGYRLLAECDFDGAIREFRAASTKSDHALSIAEAHRLSGRLVEAKRAVRKAASSDRLASFFHLESGRIAELEGRIDDARASYRRAYADDAGCIERNLRAIELNPRWPKTKHDVEDMRCTIARLEVDDATRAAWIARLDAI